VWYTYCSAAPLAGCGAEAQRVDFATGEGLEACLAACAPLDAVLNTAAISQPGACARDPDAAAAVNVPTRLLAALRASSPAALFVHLSTDQVYEGSRAFWREEEGAEGTPANAYGASKRLAEEAVSAWTHHAILRSSIIYGPEPPYAPVQRPLFLQWLDGALAAGPVELFEDEFRSPIFVQDICDLCTALLRGSPLGVRTLNVGGPERLSRADMGDAVAAVRGYPRDRVRRVPSASVVRVPASPPDISMDVTRLSSLGLRLTPFAQGLVDVFGTRLTDGRE